MGMCLDGIVKNGFLTDFQSTLGKKFQLAHFILEAQPIGLNYFKFKKSVLEVMWKLLEI